jgi:peptide/nickel transport system permease protein
VAPQERSKGEGKYRGPRQADLAASLRDSLVITAPKGTTRVNDQPMRGRRVLETGDALDLSGARATFVNLPPYMLGTDDSGRCVLSRLIHGTVIAGSVGVVSVGIYMVIGVILGALAGYYRGWVDMLISRVIEVVICFPTLFLIIMVVGVLQEPSIYYIMITLGLIRWTGVARLVRGEILKTMSEEYVSAAKALGLPTARIIFRHILPNSIAPVFVSASFGVAGAILIESSLSFLGFGVAPPTASWGEILRQGRNYVNEGMYHLVWAPGICIFVTVTMFNIVGEGLRDALDPKLRR